MYEPTNFAKIACLLFFLCVNSIIYSQGTGGDPSGGVIITNIVKICSDIDPNDLPSQCVSETANDGDYLGNLTLDHSEVEIEISVYCVNLFEDNSGTWPDGYDPIYVSYQHSETETRISNSLLNWEYFGDFAPDGETTHTIFRSRVTLTVENPSVCDWNQGAGHFDLGLRLLTLLKGNSYYTPYNVHQYGSPDDIFSCLVFQETYGNCDRTTGPDAGYNLDICVLCSSDTYNPELRKDNKPILSTSISPNPFAHYIEYSYYAENESEIEIQIISAEGQVIQNQIKYLYLGDNYFRLSTDNFSSGIYYLSIKTNESKKIHKIVKL